MIKLRVFNMKEFLKTVNECTGPVYVIQPGGKKEDMNKEFGVQRQLFEEYRKNKNMLPICLVIPIPCDYFRIVCYYAGDC